ncbi:hypothetical protein FPOA_09553 [Fusarium poae]|uniref:Uncharacterized protein n=1 Tax=Fusarium poae TaxID=36050 RepID=A0A1B8ABI2_FUSPO|nr:hypothetical protein FPOA_09553 [Fusarium poae]
MQVQDTSQHCYSPGSGYISPPCSTFLFPHSSPTQEFHPAIPFLSSSQQLSDLTSYTTSFYPSPLFSTSPEASHTTSFHPSPLSSTSSVASSRSSPDTTIKQEPSEFNMASYNFVSPSDSSLTPFVGDYQAAYTGYAASQYNPMYFTGMDPMHASGSFAGYPVAHTYAPTNAHSAYFQPVQPTIEDSIAAMLAEMSPKRREVALKIKENFPDVDTESFYKFLIKPEEDNNAERKAYVLLLRTFKIPYGYIRDLGDLDCAESTLRGIKRNATVPAEQRPRCTDEEWTPRQVFTMLVCVSEIQAQRGLTPGTDHNIPWAQVADMMARSLGEGAFKFSPMAVHRRYKLEDRFNGDDSDDDNSE